MALDEMLGVEEDIQTVFNSTEIDTGRLKRRHEEVKELNYDNSLKYHFERLLGVLLKEWERAE